MQVDLQSLYEKGHSIPEISSSTGIARSTIYFRLKKAGVLRTRSEGVKNASKKGKLGSGLRGKKRIFTNQWKENISKAKQGKGVGVSLKPNGYIEITMGPNKGKGQHVVVMEQHLGRSLKPDECVHHKDHIRHNNDIDNLELMTKSEHARLHAIENNKFRSRDENGRYR